jgi:hypothetical protein
VGSFAPIRDFNKRDRKRGKLFINIQTAHVELRLPEKLFQMFDLCLEPGPLLPNPIWG